MTTGPKYTVTVYNMLSILKNLINAKYGKLKLDGPQIFGSVGVNLFGHGGDKRSPIFKIALKNYLTSIPSD